jgi:glucan phosphoethanolaminetransferase (alkaline phosphatase superfamily)
MRNKLGNAAAIGIITSVVVLTIVVLLAIWKIISNQDIIAKSVSTIVVLFVVSVIMIIISHFLSLDQDSSINPQGYNQ